MNELQLRDLTIEDQPAYWKLACISFHSKNPELENETSFLESCANAEEKAKKNTTALGNCVIRTGIFHENKLLSALTAHAFEIHFDGKICEFCGIGGVMSDPSARNTGSASRLIRNALYDANARGQIFSHLYPFQSSFYRKFGYVHCAYKEQWTVPARFLPGDSYQIRWYENTESEQQEVMRIYEAFAADYNLSFRRSHDRWTRLFSKWNPYSGNNFSYIHESKDGADGFLSYRTQAADNTPMVILVDHLYFTSPAALRGILSFLGSQHPYVSEVRFSLPIGVDISFWLKEMCSAYDKFNVRRETVHLGASRVVNAESVLKLARYRGKGVVGIRIDDPICSWNNRTFQVEFSDDHVSVVDGAVWDIRMGIEAFTSLILGYRNLSEVAYMDDIEIVDNFDNLQKVFYRKPIWLDDSF